MCVNYQRHRLVLAGTEFQAGLWGFWLRTPRFTLGVFFHV